MKKKFILFAIFGAILLQNQSFAETNVEKAVIEENKSNIEETQASPPLLFGEIKEGEVYSQSNIIEKIRNSGVSVEVITQDDIKKQQAPLLMDLLDEVAGVTIQDQSSAGDVSSFRIRGLDSVRVMVDGLRIDAPFDHRFYLDHQLSNDIDRIEILRGPQGTVNGVQSTGGLMNITTRRGSGPLSVEFDSKMGTFNTFQERFAIQGGDSSKDYFLGITRFDTLGGMRTTPTKKVANDGYGNLTLSSNLGKRLLEGKAEVRNTFKFLRAKKDVGIGYNRDNFNQVFDPNNFSKQYDTIETFTYTHAPCEFYDYFVKFGYYNTIYKNIALPDEYTNEYDAYTRYENNRFSLTSQHNLKYKNFNTLSVGYNLQHDTYNNFYNGKDPLWGGSSVFSGNETINGVYFHDVVNIKDILFLRGGTRISTNSKWGTQATPNVSAALVLPTFNIKDSYTKIRSSYGHAINTPTLYQLYVKSISPFFTTIPNPNLEPEKLNGWDLGVVQSFFNDKIVLESGYFRNDYKKYIGYAYGVNWGDPGQYQNIDAAKTYGWENSLKVNDIVKGLDAKVNYTYTRSYDEQTYADLPGVPRNRLNFILAYSPIERLSMFFTGVTSSSRVYSQGQKTEDGFFNGSVGTNIRLCSFKNLQLVLQAKVKNITNNKYEVSPGYQHPGISFLGGVFLRYNTQKETL